jgi:uncharacterized membrane protein
MKIIFERILQIYFYFIICSFVGWIIESTFWSFKIKKISNSGFLYGPFIPIYGFGALFIFLLTDLTNFLILPLRFLLFTLIATLLEYFVSLLLEKIFSIKLWDYSNEKFNFQGRICLKYSFFWLILIIFDVLFFQPFLFGIIQKIDIRIIQFFLLLFTLYLFIDLFFSTKLYFHFTNIIKPIKQQTEYLIQKNIKDRINALLVPINHFPDLKKEVERNTSLFSKFFVNDLKFGVNKLFNIKDMLEDFYMKAEKEKAFYKIYCEITNNSEYKKLKKINHHKNVSIYEHNIKVAWISYNIAKKLNLRLDEITKGALLHDFFLYDWRHEKPRSGKLHGFDHPKEALENSLKYFSPLTSLEKDIILKHMWPLTISPPRYTESFIVCVVDKIVATYELIFTGKKKS